MGNTIVLFLIFTSFITLSIALYAFKRREETSSLPFAALMLAASIHAFGYAFELYSQSSELVMMWLHVEYVGIAFFPFLLVWMTYVQKNEENSRNTMVLIVFFAVSLMTFFLVQSNSLHHLYYSDVHIVRGDELSHINFSRGPWYYVHAAFAMTSFFIMGFHNFKLYKVSKRLYKDRAFNAIVSLVIPLCASIVYVLQLTPQNVDALPFVYMPIGLLWLTGFKKYGIFDLIPVTYKRIFEHISEGVIVLDQNNTIVNFNMAAFQIFKRKTQLYKGIDLQSVLNDLTFINNEDYPGKVFELDQNRLNKVYHLKRTNIYDKKERHFGKIIVINDITKEIEATRVLTTLATQDALTGINNRRHFFDLCHHKINKAKTEGKRISFVLMDIDHFKNVNDTYGHAVGDHVLKEVTELCSKTLRGTDLIGRYGGEEFAILLYDAGLSVTHNIIERMRQIINSHDFIIDDDIIINLTVSFGVYRPELITEYDVNAIFNKADKGLYKAKSDGRDRIVFYNDFVG